MPEQFFSNYSILQRGCKKQEAQWDTMAHSLQNTYQWILSWVEESGEVATFSNLYWVAPSPPSSFSLGGDGDGGGGGGRKTPQTPLSAWNRACLNGGRVKKNMGCNFLQLCAH